MTPDEQNKLELRAMVGQLGPCTEECRAFKEAIIGLLDEMMDSSDSKDSTVEALACYSGLSKHIVGHTLGAMLSASLKERDSLHSILLGLMIGIQLERHARQTPKGVN